MEQTGVPSAVPVTSNNRWERGRYGSSEISAKAWSFSVPLLLAQLVTLGVICAMVVLAIDVPKQVFRSPDENASFIFTKALATTGRLSYELADSANDEENLLHPRGGLTVNDKVVPFNFLGLHIVYAPFYKVLGDRLTLIAIPMALVSVTALASAAALIYKERPWVPWLAILGAAPIINVLTRPLMNFFPALMFGSIAVYFGIRYAKTNSRLSLAICSICFALTSLMRYEMVILGGLAMVAAIVLVKGFRRSAILDFLIVALAVCVLFVVPVMVLNTELYGSPTSYGYGLFNEVYFSDRVGSSSFPGGYLQQLRSILLPSYPFDLGIAWRSLIYQVAGVAPLFGLLSLCGAVVLVAKDRIPLRIVLPAGALLCYAYAYRAAGDSWLAGTHTPSWEASVVRYSTPLYIFGFFLVCHLLSKIQRDSWCFLLVGVIAVTGVGSVTFATDGNFLFIRERLQSSEVELQKILNVTEPDAVIYTDTYDKVLSDRREVASWWGGGDAVEDEVLFNPHAVADSIKKVVVANRPTYLLISDPGPIEEKLTAPLKERGLRLVKTKYVRLLQVMPVASFRQAPGQE
jgi:hypothetical protein